MNVLVVGGSGYIGSMLGRWLWCSGHYLRNFDAVLGNDICDSMSFGRACEGADAVIYLAALSNNDDYNANPELGDEVNIHSFARNVALAASVGVKRFIYASSVAAYGSSIKPLTETKMLAPTTLYGKAKAICEETLLNHAHKDFCVTIARSASVFGWSPVMRWDVTINKMIHDAQEDRLITVYGGKQIRSHIHIKDLCEAYGLLLNSGKQIHRQAFNIVAFNQSVIDSAHDVAGILKAKVMVEPRTDDRSYAVSGVKAKKVLGFKPRYDIEYGIREFL